MDFMLKEFDEMRKHIKTREGKLLAKVLRKRLAARFRYSEKLDIYFIETMDGAEPSREAKRLKLI